MFFVYAPFVRRRAFWDIAYVISAEIVVSMILFTGVVMLLVFLIRPRLRKHKPIDLEVFDRLVRVTNPSNNRIILFITFLGSHKVLIPANLALIAYFLFIRPNAWYSIRVIAIALSSLVLMLLLKALFQRKRPLAPLLRAAKGLSFPSGHSIMAVTFYGLLIYILMHTVHEPALRYVLTVCLIALILLIGFSRIYLRVHYASDVLAGFIIGLLWLLISQLVLGRVEKYTTTHPSPIGRCIGPNKVEWFQIKPTPDGIINQTENSPRGLAIAART